jgi:tetratricopeptide (TPR) repeat protein
VLDLWRSYLELEQALTDCNEAVRVGPANGPALNSRAFIFLRLGRFDEALADYDRALDRPLSDHIAYGFMDVRAHYALFGRGIAKLRLDDTEGGNADISAAEKMRPGVTVEFALYGIKP